MPAQPPADDSRLAFPSFEAFARAFAAAIKPDVGAWHQEFMKMMKYGDYTDNQDPFFEVFFVRHLEFESGQFPGLFMNTYTTTTRDNTTKELQNQLATLAATLNGLHQEETNVQAQQASTARARSLEDIRRRRQAAVKAQRAAREKQTALQRGAAERQRWGGYRAWGDQVANDRPGSDWRRGAGALYFVQQDVKCLRCIEKECDWCEVNVGLGRCSTCETAKKPCIFGNLRLSGEVLSSNGRTAVACYNGQGFTLYPSGTARTNDEWRTLLHDIQAAALYLFAHPFYADVSRLRNTIVAARATGAAEGEPTNWPTEAINAFRQTEASWQLYSRVPRAIAYIGWRGRAPLDVPPRPLIRASPTPAPQVPGEYGENVGVVLLSDENDANAAGASPAGSERSQTLSGESVRSIDIAERRRQLVDDMNNAFKTWKHTSTAIHMGLRRRENADRLIAKQDQQFKLIVDLQRQIAALAASSAQNVPALLLPPARMSPPAGGVTGQARSSRSPPAPLGFAGPPPARTSPSQGPPPAPPAFGAPPGFGAAQPAPTSRSSSRDVPPGGGAAPAFGMSRAASSSAAFPARAPSATPMRATPSTPVQSRQSPGAQAPPAVTARSLSYAGSSRAPTVPPVNEDEDDEQEEEGEAQPTKKKSMAKRLTSVFKSKGK